MKLLVLFLLSIGSAIAQPADILFLNGKVLVGDDRFTVQQALAVRESRVLAVGSNLEIQKLAGKATRRVDLQGRSVIPGLIDSHMHAIRAALSFATEVNWIGAATLEEALGRVREAAKRSRPGGWLIVAGGWTEQQFREKRRPKYRGR